MKPFNAIVIALLSCLLSSQSTAEQPKGPQHGLELYGSPKYPKDFKHFEYVNPDAPKGGQLVLGGSGTFDSLNPFVIKGTPAAGMSSLYPSYFYATLMQHAADEPLSTYGYVADTVELADDGKSITFTIREGAKFHDGSPITAADVAFSFNTLKEKGNPFYKSYYRKVLKVEALGTQKVRFEFTVAGDKELPLIVGDIPILSKAYYAKHDFNKSDIIVPMGSGPYEISDVDAGKSITYKRLKNWWGADLPVNKGRYNFDTIKIIYFRDSTVALEAFKAGDVNFRVENTAKNWVTSYDSPAFKSGEYVKEEIIHTMPSGMTGLIFNIRKPIFQDINVRKAVALAFDFEWANKNLFYNLYQRHNSYFSNCELASSGLPQSEELKILEPFKAQLPAEVFTQQFKMPVNNGTSGIRNQLRKAKELLQAAGWDVKDGELVNKKTGEPFDFEILIVQAELARVINGFVQNLRTLGINANIRVVDTAQYEERINSFDYDTIWGGFGQSITPGNEQAEYFSSKAADAMGSKNYIGIKNPVVDVLVEDIIHAEDRESLKAYVHALDRVLLWNYYMVPGYYLGAYWIAYWSDIKHPKVMPKYGLDMDSWWHEEKSK